MIPLRNLSRLRNHLQCYMKRTIQFFCTSTNGTNDDTSSSSSNKNSNWIEAPTLPCFFTQFDALETFNLWARRQWFAPRSFKKDTEKYVHVIHKYYVPYWHFDASAHSKYHASISPDAERTKESSTSCMYSSSQPEMQFIASDRLTSDESKFLSIPLGPTQFQRMTHHVDDLLPDTVHEQKATEMVRAWIQSTETKRVHTFVTEFERLHKPIIQSDVELNCRKAYMPCFIIHFNPTIPNPKEQPDAISESIPAEASYRCIVHGYNGNVQGPRLYSFIKCAKWTLPLAFMSIYPIGIAMLFPSTNVALLSLSVGLSIASVMQTPLFTSRVKRVEGHTLDTQHLRLKEQQMQEKEVEDILKEAEKSWGSHTHRSRPIAREQERTRKESYERFEQTTAYYNKKVKEYDEEGRPIGRRRTRFIELYETLGISPNASTREIQQAFTRLAKKYHPDQLQQQTEHERQVGEDKFQKVLLAFQVLKDPERRKTYDMTGSVREDRKRNKSPTQGENDDK
eukprot:226066_1